MIELLQTLVICWGLKDLLYFLGDLISDLKIKNKGLNIIKYLLTYILTCSKCASMWISLILTGSLFISVLISIIINYLTQLEYKYKKTEL